MSCPRLKISCRSRVSFAILGEYRDRPRADRPSNLGTFKSRDHRRTNRRPRDRHRRPRDLGRRPRDLGRRPSLDGVRSPWRSRQQ
jgi:hypothetical protein